jgi:hypothetical protein
MGRERRSIEPPAAERGLTPMFELTERTVTEKKPALRRIYVVTDAVGEKHLVNAGSPGQATGHVYKPLVRVAGQQDLVSMRQVDVEEAI